MEPKAYIQLQEQYGGKFVAIRNGQVVAIGNTHKELVDSIKKNMIERKNLNFEYIERKDAVCIYRISLKR